MNVTTTTASGVGSAYAQTSGKPAASGATGGQTPQPQYLNSSTMFTVTELSHDTPEWLAEYNRVQLTRSGPMLAADEAIKTIEARLNSFRNILAFSRPDLAKSDWDVTIQDGKLKVTGDLLADDKRQMEDRLNRDKTLVNAVDAYMSAAHSYLETTDLNTAYTGANGYTGRQMLYNFKDVDQQLEGKISFRELINTSWRQYDNPYGGAPTDPGNYRGGSSLEILASRLTSTPLAED